MPMQSLSQTGVVAVDLIRVSGEVKRDDNDVKAFALGKKKDLPEVAIWFRVSISFRCLYRQRKKIIDLLPAYITD